MIQTAFVSVVTASLVTLNSMPFNLPKQEVLASASMSLDNRQVNPELNQIYKDNILLNLAYLNGTISKDKEAFWTDIYNQNLSEFTLKPGEVFAYHDTVLPEYQGKVARTTNSHFNVTEGYKTDGYLYGMGVCHFASLIHMAAHDAGLNSVAPSNHDFAVIREIPSEYGVSIYTTPNSPDSSARQNLYITNNFETDVTFRFEYDTVNLKVSILKNF